MNCSFAESEMAAIFSDKKRLRHALVQEIAVFIRMMAKFLFA